MILAGPFDCVEELLAAADVYVAPAPDAGLSLALLEAMAAGKPICASDIPDHRHFLAGGECGLLARREDPDSLAEGVLRLFKDDSAAQRLGQAARERARACFNLVKSASAHLALFHDLLES